MFIPIDKDKKITLIRQIFEGIRLQILEGKLSPHTKLPSSRELAEQLAVSRNVVLEAYDLLHAEGYVCTAHGSGTYVAEGAAYPMQASPLETSVTSVGMGYDAPAGIINFKSGTPDLSLFPLKIWTQLLKQTYAQHFQKALGYGNSEGRIELRKAIRDYVATHRGIRCHPDQIVITAGTTQAIAIAAKLVLGEKNDVLLEDPITRDIQYIFANNGGTVTPVPVDTQGLQTDLLPDMDTACIYVTPSHQFPIGGILPIQRRIDLLNYAQEHNSYIIEDDYDSEFRYDGAPISSLYELNPAKVIYIGTFSKTLCPSLRTGYIILPPELILRAREQKWHSDLHNETATQLTLAEFIRRGHYSRHVLAMKKLYHKRRDYVVDTLQKLFGNRVSLTGHATGLHLCASFEGITFTQELLDKIEKAGARFYPASFHAFNNRNFDNTLIIGFGHLEESEIRSGLTLLHTVLS